MKILLLTGVFYPKTAGGAFEDWNFSKIAAERGHDIHVYTSKTSGTPSSETVSGVTIHRPFRASPQHRHPNSKLGQLMRVLFVLRLAVYLLVTLDRDYDVIYSTGHMFHPIAKLIGISYRLPVINLVAYSPSIDPTRLSAIDLRVLFERVNFRFFMGDIVLSRTPQIRQLLESKYGVPAQVVHGIIDEEDLRCSFNSDGASRLRYEVAEDKKLLVFVGRFVSVKNPVVPVAILNELPEKYSLLMVGGGMEREHVKSVADNYGVTDRVQLTGELPHSETLQIISMADALLLTSDVEAYPTVVFEALTLKTPVVATPVGILEEMSHPRLTVCSKDRMAQKIESLKQQSENGIDEETLHQYSITQFTDEVLAVLESQASGYGSQNE